MLVGKYADHLPLASTAPDPCLVGARHSIAAPWPTWWASLGSIWARSLIRLAEHLKASMKLLMDRRPGRRFSIAGAGRTKTDYLSALGPATTAAGSMPIGATWSTPMHPTAAGRTRRRFLHGFEGILAARRLLGLQPADTPIPKGRRTDPRRPLLGPRAAQAEGGVRGGPRWIRDRGRRPAAQR